LNSALPTEIATNLSVKLDDPSFRTPIYATLTGQPVAIAGTT